MTVIGEPALLRTVYCYRYFYLQYREKVRLEIALAQTFSAASFTTTVTVR
jgi:hypothetical protein